MSADTHSPKKILIIRRDNIGDLILTTPLLHALKKHFPATRIDVLTNSYCAPVLDRNPDVNQVFVYEKGHHRGERSLFGVYLNRLRLIWRLRREKYDHIVLGKPSVEPRPLQLARLIGSPNIVGITEAGSHFEKYLSHPLYWHPAQGLHLAERCMQLLAPFGIAEPAGPLRIFPDPALATAFKQQYIERFGDGKRLIALQISSRKQKQRWPIEQFAALAQKLHARHDLVFALFWSPGPKDNPMHPGDDENAQALVKQLPANFPIMACPTQSLGELIAGLAVAEAMITSDGGALHIGAASGLPTLCFFGNSEASRWHPWSVPYRLIQKTSNDVRDISVDEAMLEFEHLFATMEQRKKARHLSA